MFGLLFPLWKLCVNFVKNGLGYMLGDFLTIWSPCLYLGTTYSDHRINVCLSLYVHIYRALFCELTNKRGKNFQNPEMFNNIVRCT
jgi:hypothetical protein